MTNVFSSLRLIVRYIFLVVFLIFNTVFANLMALKTSNLIPESNTKGNVRFKSNSAVASQQILRLQISNGSSVDEAILYSNSGASDGYDAYDSPKMFNASASMPEIYTLAGSEQVAINGMKNIVYDTEYQVGILILNATVSTYTIRASEFLNFPTGAKILLKDKLNPATPVTTDLSTGSSYSFTSGTANYNTSRFAMIFKSPDPSISTTGTLSAVNTSYGTAGSYSSFNVSGSFLTNNIVITPPAGYEISKTSGGASGYASSQTLTQTGGTVAQTTLYVRLAASTGVGSYSGNISCVSSGASTVNIATVSSTVSPKGLTINGLSGVNKAYDATNSATITGTPNYSGLVNSENFSVSGTPTATFADETVGTGKTITVSGYSAPSANYTLTQPTCTANITPLSGIISSSASIGTSALLPGTDITVQPGVLFDIDNSSTLHSLVVNPGGKVSLESGKTLNVGTFTLQSDASGTATFVDNGGTLNATSSSVQQYLKAGRNWYVGSPVTTATSSVFSATELNPILWYDEVHGTDAPWTLITDGTASLTPMKGYVATVATDGIVTFTGTLNTGAQSINISRTSGQYKEGFNLIANPYPSYLDWDQLSKTNLSTTMWYRTQTAGAAYTFDTYNSTGHVGISNGTKAVTKLIPPMQAFWVRVNAGQNQVTVSVDNTQRAHADIPENTFKSKSSLESKQALLRLQLSNGINTDETIIYANADASGQLDEFDSPKMFSYSNAIAEVFTVVGTDTLAINGLNAIPYDTEIPLGFSTASSGTFSFKASQFSNFDPGTQLILKDYQNVNNPITTDMADGSNYNFSSDVSVSNTSRFTLTIKAPSIATGISHGENNPILVSTNGNGQLLINGTQTGETIVSVYDVAGQKLLSETLTSTSGLLHNQFAAGVYLVTVTNTGKSVTQKVIIR